LVLLWSWKLFLKFTDINYSFFVCVKQVECFLDVIFGEKFLVVGSSCDEVHVAHEPLFFEVSLLDDILPFVIDTEGAKLLLVLLELFVCDFTIIIRINLLKGDLEQLEIILIYSKTNQQRSNSLSEFTGLGKSFHVFHHFLSLLLTKLASG